MYEDSCKTPLRLRIYWGGSLVGESSASKQRLAPREPPLAAAFLCFKVQVRKPFIRVKLALYMMKC